MNNYRAIYKMERVTQNTRLEPDGYSCLRVLNSGMSPLVVNGAVSLPANSTQWLDFLNEPYVTIDSYIDLAFTTPAEAEAVVVKVYYKQK